MPLSFNNRNDYLQFISKNNHLKKLPTSHNRRLMKKIFTFLYLFLSVASVFAQLPTPTDFLSKDFHKGRREALRQMMPANSVFVTFAFPTRNFSNDTDYKYHANPDLYYLSGYTEPNAVLFIFKESQKDSANREYNEVFFVQKKDPAREQWTGKRLGIEGVKEKLGFSQVYNSSDFPSAKLDLSKFDKVIFDLPNEITDKPGQTDDIFDLLEGFRSKSGMPEDADPEMIAELTSLSHLRAVNTSGVRPRISGRYKNLVENPRFKKNSLANRLAVVKDSADMAGIFSDVTNMKWNTSLHRIYMDQLRQIKTEEEMVLMRKAIDISALAHNEAMKAAKPEMSELELQGVQEFVHKKLGAEYVGYPSIAGAGNNGCVLHYVENNVTSVGNKMVLMDIGAEYHGYSADVTRTFPANGKFSADQALIYNIVYEAQEAVFKIAKEGTSFAEIEKTARAVVTKGLVNLGILKDEKQDRLYYPHGCSHFLGLDVHDRGVYEKLYQNMVITVEPGIYIPEGSDCDKKWWGIAVRIEDDVLIGKEKCELLSGLAARKLGDVEKMASQKSFTDNLIIGIKK
jgi:Xaa-Pro aminopeptidase